jgi:hypothetical protein
MRLLHACVFAAGAALVLPALHAQQRGAAAQQDADVKVANGGIFVTGWQGRPDAGSVNDARLSQEGADLRVQTGPAISYWNPANTASGSYMVKATFTEAKQTMSHAHPFGVFIGGSDLGTDQQSLLYCVAYRNGKPLVRGLNGSTPFNVLALRRADPPVPGVNQAPPDQPVTQEIAWHVMGGSAECMINGQSMGKWTAAELTGAGKLKSLDGVYGIRVAHNVDVVIKGFGASKMN